MEDTDPFTTDSDYDEEGNNSSHNSKVVDNSADDYKRVN